VKSVIVLGGYGGFGARLSKRLAADGWTVLVAGRNAAAAERLAAALPNARPLVADRTADLRPVLQAHRPFLLIDAAGPFQGSGYQVADACIACGVHYIDLADARDFVCGIGQLDAAAKAAGVAVVSGGSSVPALSGAVVAELSRDMEEVCSVETSISASNRATAGASVAAAILSYVGKPVRLWRGQRWRQDTGWHRLHVQDYHVPGRMPIRRLVALADVPDHDIVPSVVPGKPATTFRAGPEFAFQLLTLWLLSWPVKWGWVRSLSPFARWLLPLQTLSARLGTDRSAMAIEVKGISGGEPVARRWTLIAEKGDGPEIPTIAAHVLANALAAGRVAPGARHAAGQVKLGDFDSHFDRLALFRAIESRPYLPLYRRVMGPAHAAMPAPVRAMHDLIGDAGACGSATVRRGSSLFARFICTVMRFPPEGAHALHVSFEERNGVERWIRDFTGHTFASDLSQRGDRLVERFGPMRFSFDLPSDASGLRMVMRGWSMLGVPMPLWLAPRSEAREWAEGDDFCFDVPIGLPGIGMVVHYAGRLRRV
jgi:saccharopine dehydrogenase-like NADP-dependent oxidoreductase